jgi:hypothetical protein
VLSSYTREAANWLRTGGNKTANEGIKLSVDADKG